MIRILFLLLALFSSCGGGYRQIVKVGIDPDWNDINLYGKQAYVNGFVEELLLEISRYSGLEFEKIEANWDSLLDDLEKGKYDVAICALPRYIFNLDHYDFSMNILDAGPVLILPASVKAASLDTLSGKVVGYQTNDSLLLLQKNPGIIPRNYNQISDLLNAIVSGEIEGGLLDQVVATSYVRDLYSGKLTIMGRPLTNLGIHFIVDKGKEAYVMSTLKKSFDHLKKKGKVSLLLQKWNLEQASGP